MHRGLILYFRIAMGWTFLYAGLTQLTEPGFTAAAFLGHTKTFHGFFSLFAAPAVLPYTDFLVKVPNSGNGPAENGTVCQR